VAGLDNQIERATHLGDLGRTDDAISAFEAVLAQEPDNVRALLGLTRVLLPMHYPRALQTAKRAISLAPNDYRTHLTASYAASKCGMHADAMRFAGRSVKLQPQVGQTHLSLSSAIVNCNDERHLPRARQAAQTAIELNPDSADAWFANARVDLAHEWLYQAEQSIDRALAIDPSHRGAQGVKSVLDRHSGKGASALSLLQSLMIDDPSGTWASEEFDTTLDSILVDLLWAFFAIGMVLVIVIATVSEQS